MNTCDSPTESKKKKKLWTTKGKFKKEKWKKNRKNWLTIREKYNWFIYLQTIFPLKESIMRTNVRQSNWGKRIKNQFTKLRMTVEWPWFLKIMNILCTTS